MNFIKFLSLLILSFFSFNQTVFSQNLSIDKIIFEDIDGKDFKLSNLPGKIILIVNTASYCGFTKQYKELQALTSKYSSKDLSIIAIPSNDFGKQEPGSNEEIKDFCETNFNINFPMTSKYDVKGENAHDVYKWAKDTFGKSAVPKWNFHKILIDKNGKIHDTFVSFTNPMSKKIIKELENIL